MENRPINQVIEDTIKEALQALEDPFVFERPISRVAVIGCGPSGLVAGKTLKDKGFEVQIFDRGSKVGGNWAYGSKKLEKPFIPRTKEDEDHWLKEADPLPDYVNSTEPIQVTPEVEEYLLGKHHPPSACYEYLENNTPTPVLGSFEFPWPKDTPNFVSHARIQQYYQDFAQHFDLLKHIQFYTSLEKVEKCENGWELTLLQVIYLNNGEQVKFNKYKQTFDAVVLATGQFQYPFMPYTDGLYDFQARFPERIFHAKQFIEPEQFEKKKVLVVGGNISSMDIINMLNAVGCDLYLSIRGPMMTGIPIIDLIRGMLPKNTTVKPGLEGFWSKQGEEKVIDGTVRFTDGTEVEGFDAIIFATGYISPYSYLGALRSTPEDIKNENENSESLTVVTDAKKILNAYKDIFLIHDPTLAFVGTPKHLTSTPFFDYQAHAVARVWSKQAVLPSKKLMKQMVENYVPGCPAFGFNGETERIRAENIVPWINLHAEKLVPESNLPALKGPLLQLDDVWQDGLDNWAKNATRFFNVVEEKRKLKSNGI
ncbi:hypothetical protein BJ944DRAFT_232582 [Cunninghamella echinulata]|nr:hypothetical protein BJ944DRAFT_232582 [Cunninghamella echinulata]